MKRKRIGLALILLVCICVSMLALTACNKPADESYNYSTAQMYAEIKQKLQNSVGVSGNYGIDVDAVLKSDDRTSDDADANYRLTLKGDIYDDTQPTLDSNFLLEFNRIEDEGGKTLLGVGFEDDTQGHLYININDGGYEKINGVSLSALTGMTDKTKADNGLDIESMLVSALFGTTGTLRDGVYTFKFDLASALENLRVYLPVLQNLIDINIDSVIAAMFGHLSFEQDGAQISVSSYDNLIRYIRKNISFTGEIKLAFDGDTLTTASAQFENSKSGSMQKVYTFDLPKFSISQSQTPYNVLDGLAINVYDVQGNKTTTTDRQSVAAKNLLNFSLGATAQLKNDATDTEQAKTTHYYSITLNADIDPFKLLALKDVQTKEQVLELLATLGYVNLTVDGTDAQGNHLANVATVHCNFEDMSAIAFFDGFDFKVAGMVDVRTELGGYYSFDALYDTVAMIKSGSNATTVADSALTLIGGLLRYVNVSNDGIDVRISEMIKGLCISLNLDEGVGEYLTPIVDSADVLHIDVDKTEFGKCNRVATDSIVAPQGSEINIYNIEDLYYAQAVPSLPTVVEAGDDYVAPGYAADDTRLIFTTSDFTSAFNGYIMGVDGYDSATAGEQSVTLYIGFGTELQSLLELLRSLGVVDISPLVPLFGVQKYSATVRVYPYEENTEITSDSAENLSTVIGRENEYGASLDQSIYELIGRYGNGEFSVVFYITSPSGVRSHTLIEPTYKVFDSLGADVTASAVKSDKFTSEGVYTVRIYYNDNYYFDRTITVTRFTSAQ